MNHKDSNTLIVHILEAARVPLERPEDAQTTMESLLGLSGLDCNTLEDFLPLSDDVMRATTEWLESAWREDSSGGSSGPQVTRIDTMANITLESLYGSVRATKWICLWNEFNLGDDSQKLFSRLLQSPLGDNLILSFYSYLEGLSFMLHQIHALTKGLRPSDPHSMVLSERLKRIDAAQSLSIKLEAEWEEHMQRITQITGELYVHATTSQRRATRRLLGQFWTSFSQKVGNGSGRAYENTQAIAISPTLKLLRRILLGSSSNHDSLLPLLIDLHKPDAIILWRDQTPVLDLYHEPLCQCLALLVQKNSGLISEILSTIPITGNSAKQVLILHEISHLMELLTKEEEYPDVASLTIFTKTLAESMASENSHIAEQALQFFRNKTFRYLVLERNAAVCFPIILSAILRNDPSWNPTVRKMTLFVLKEMESQNQLLFVEACNQSNLSGSTHSDFSLKAGMKGWKPSESSRPPPATATGVAPWARSSKSLPMGSNIGKSAAPWARTVNSSSAILVSRKTKGYDLAKVFMKKLQDSTETTETGESSWSKEQMADATKLLPNLKFHDLVFGHELGQGAFGVVKYARKIVQPEPRSKWPEYAVKIVSTQKIHDFGYEQPIQREIAILQLMTHPGIARLVSSFQFSEGVYLVLEYASGGDLHSVLKRQGSLNEDSTRFVMGEVIAAITSVHEKGFVYGDLKPENVVITESGHVKITDFGAARPVTEASKLMIRETSRNLLNGLRDGGWKKPEVLSDVSEKVADEMSDSDCESFSDDRIEGTTAYLPPEVLSGEKPRLEADTWACGCVTYQCLTGRPPLLDKDDERTKQRIVHFHDSGAEKEDGLGLFVNHHDGSMSKVSQEFIQLALTRPVNKRPLLSSLVIHPFFEGKNLQELYKGVPTTLDVGSCAPTLHAQWSRRQMSSIWAPQPRTYDLSKPSSSSGFWVDGNEAPIHEENEKDALFVSSRQPTPSNSKKRAIRLPPM